MEALFGKKKRRPGGALVLYTTRHGATQRYAERIAEPLDALIKDAAYMSGEKAKSYDAIVVGCCVYEGRIQGLDFLKKNAEALADERLVLYVVGIEDPAQEDIRHGLKAQLREALGGAAETIPTFFLRGAIRWRSLGVLEQVKMRSWMKAIRAKERRTATEDMLLEAEGGAIDFSDEADLAPIVHAARFGAEGEI